MTKRYLQALLLIILFLNQSFSQIKISGHVKDKKNNPIEFVEVLLQNKDSIIFNSELTNAEGKFTLEVKKGEFTLLIRQFGVIYHKQEINATQDIYIGVINITVKTMELQEVVITSKKKLIERKVDRLVFNVENSISASGGDAIDALKSTPNIRVQNDAISMIGKNNLAVMVDDKIIQLAGEDLINFLKTLSSDNIRSIEVITTPPAKYDAEGNSGLINIKLKKTKNDSWNASLRNTVKQATYLSYNVGSNFSYQKKKFSLLADIGFAKTKTIYENDITYDYPDASWKKYMHNTNIGNVIIPSISLNYKIKEKTSIGVQYFGAYNKPIIYDYSMSDVTDKATAMLNKIYFSDGKSFINYARNSFNINGVTKFDDNGKNMSFDIDYFNFINNKDNPFTSSIIDGSNNLLLDNSIVNNSKLNIKNYAAKLDFVLPTTFANYEYGGKISYTYTDSEVDLNFYDNLTYNNYLYQEVKFDYKENTQAFYFSANKKIKKWEFKAGLRYESTQTKGNSITEKITNNKNYFKLFPTLYTVYSPNDNQSLSITFNSRINRPGYDYVNPARRYTSINSYVYGNPFLQPFFTYNLELQHSYKDIFTSTFSYSNTINSISQLNIPKTDNTQLSTWENYADFYSINFDESVNFKIKDWWTTVSSIYGYYKEYKSHTAYIAPRGSGMGSGLETRHTFTINKDKTFYIESSYSYDTPSVSLQTKLSSFSSLDISFKKLYIHKNLQFTLAFNNILKSDRITYNSKTNEINQSFRQYYDTRSIRFSLLYKFGSNKVSVKQRKLGNQEEIQRTN